MNEPVAARPCMPGYGTLPAGEGRGLLPWSWVEERLVRSHDFWLATVTPGGAPHLMPVWAVWQDGRLWFSSWYRARIPGDVVGLIQARDAVAQVSATRMTAGRS